MNCQREWVSTFSQAGGRPTLSAGSMHLLNRADIEATTRIGFVYLDRVESNECFRQKVTQLLARRMVRRGGLCEHPPVDWSST